MCAKMHESIKATPISGDVERFDSDGKHGDQRNIHAMTTSTVQSAKVCLERYNSSKKAVGDKCQNMGTNIPSKDSAWVK